MPDTVRSILLFAAAAVLEIGGAWLIWQGVREHRGVAWVGVGIAALAGYGFIATFQPDPNFGRILAAYGGVFVAGSLLWGVVADGFRPDRYDLFGAASLPRWCRGHHVGSTTCLTSCGGWGGSVSTEPGRVWVDRSVCFS